MESTVTQQLERVPEVSSFSIKGFDHAQRVAKMLAASSLVPTIYQGKIENVMIALEFANRIGASPLMVMQNLNIIKGKPSWGSSFIIAALNSCKRFSPLQFKVSGQGDALECYAWAYAINTKEQIVGPTVTMKMAKAEGWYDKEGSKWKTMPELMVRYRAAAFFGRLYAPELLMGMHSADEIQDIEATVVPDGATETKDSIVDNEPITFETLQHLYDEKLALLTKREMDAAKRILDNKEVDSFQKLFKFLNEKQAEQ